MLFNSWKFMLFFAMVLPIYWLLDKKKQNLFLVTASYVFYSAWDYRFTALLLGNTAIGFYCGKKIFAARTPSTRKFFLLFSIVYNIGTLCVFKYYGFFIDNFQSLLSKGGIEFQIPYLNIILPIGISFFNFHVLSYTIDLYRKEMEPTPRFTDFALFVSFFPLLVAGPIERAKHFLPQIEAKRIFLNPQFRQGLWLFFWGLWKKVFVAENLAPLVDQGFLHAGNLSFPTLYLTLVAFAFQIYCDFSGYTDMARGCANLMGFELLTNFNLPYFATNPSDFWKRWHISLSSWLRDYLYFGLGGNRKGKSNTYRNLFLTMAIGGLWHGAAWNYVLWGIYQGLILIGFHFYNGRVKWQLPRYLSMAIMFQFTLFGWLLFRANRSILQNGHRIDDSLNQMKEIIFSSHALFQFDQQFTELFLAMSFYIAPLLLVQLFQYRSHELGTINFLPKPMRIIFQAFILFLIVRYGVQNAGSFIYFQF